ncbi:ABC transporter substrate-binding protein [Streptomyces mirabilis]|uniref:ABC transporter substrate-binding protein n=1 Tax=Streptomyces mirabilis TaxID=68239 RepID=A0ABU3V5A2_9ACTN|nr:ABC transporter substrate-binding protein [Streptomyces mirabilis]MCX5355710.1 ABC transporter substrate-binding protein [Streptomyces mirabilis]MDU9001353.1 ABC transporter substrate-binding protein [Streptomyces mirabilis]
MNPRKKWLVLPSLMLFSSSLLTGCGSGLGWSSGPPMVVGMSDDVLAVDPASGYDPGSWLLFNNVFQSLLTFPNGGTEPEPDAARKCLFTDTRARVYRCTLKDGLKFSNGDPLTAEDVKFSFERVLRINDPAGPAVLLQSLDRVDTPDDRTVVFRLRTSDATFPSKIASGAGSIVDHRVYDPDGLRKEATAVGSGPYKLDSFDKQKAVFSVNPNYKGVTETKNSGVTLRFFHGNQTALKESVVEGAVDVAYRGLNAQDIADIDEQIGKKNLDVVEGTSAEVQHLVFNMKDPIAGNLGVRKAIAYVLDREALIKQVYHGTAIPLYSLIPAGIVGHDTAFFDRYGSLPSKKEAAAALRAEGVEGKVKLTLWSTPSRYGPATDQELSAIADQLNASGLFRADVRSLPFDQYEKAVAAGRFGVFVKGWVPDYPDADNFTSPFFGKGNVLENNYSNRTITTTLLPRTAAETNRAATTQDFERLQDIVAEQLPVLPVWQGKQYAVVRDDVRGYEYCLDPSTIFRFWELYKA